MAVNKNHPAFIATHTHCDWWPEYVSNDYRKGHEVIFGETDIFKNLAEEKRSEEDTLDVTKKDLIKEFYQSYESLEESPYSQEEYDYRKKLEKAHQSQESLEPVSPLMLLASPGGGVLVDIKREIEENILADDPNVKTYM